MFDYFSNSTTTIKRPEDRDAFGNVLTPEQTIHTNIASDLQDNGSSLRRAQLIHQETQAVLFLFIDVDAIEPEDVAVVDGVNYTVINVNTLDNSIFLTK